MAAGSTYTPIATTTISGTPTSFTFSSIPSTYTDLVLVMNGTQSFAAGIYLQFNGDTGSNYSNTAIYGDGSTAASYRQSSQTQGQMGAFYTTESISIFNIMNYANTTTNKTAIGRTSNAGNQVAANVILWRSTSTAAINSIKINCQSPYTFGNGSVFTLYGIAAA